MSIYKCSFCEFKSDYKCNVINHINKQKKCTDKDLKVIKIRTIIKCNICDNIFSDKNSLNRHLKKCKLNNDDINNNNNNKKIKELEDKVAELSNIISNININTTNNNHNSHNTQINNNYITITLTPYNDPNMEGMQQYLEAAIRKTFLSVPTLIESVHFNEEYPENHNICIKNKRTKDAKVFDGKKWKTVNKDTLLTEIVDTYERELTNYAEEQGKTKYIKEYNKAKSRGNAEKDLKEEVHNVIYDNSDKINTKNTKVDKLIKRSDTQEMLNNEEYKSDHSETDHTESDHIESDHTESGYSENSEHSESDYSKSDS